MNVSFAPPSLTFACDLLVLAADDGSLAPPPALIDEADRALGGALVRAIADERWKGKPGQSVVIHSLGKLPTVRVAVLGLGARDSIDAGTLRALGGRIAKLANSVAARSVGLLLASPPPDTLDETTVVRAVAEGARLGSYRFDKYIAEDKRKARTLGEITLLMGAETSARVAATAQAEHAATAVARARDLVNEPAGFLTPTRLATIAQGWSDETRGGLSLKTLDRAACAAEGMGLFLAVAQGSQEEPRFLHMAWTPPGARKKIVLIGKGVTFDSGGLSLKTNEGMLDMKTDMAGAAAVIAAMPAIAAENLPIEVHALAACAENMPSGTSYKLGDVLRSKAGKTVEINNTDAEGRLTLADAITYGLALSPDAIFDFATLTGACMVALGPHIAGVMSNDEPLAASWLGAAKSAGEEMWRLPLPDRLFDQLKSDVADMKNTGERWGGALTAGLFLREFVAKTPWVHVDLAGPSSITKESGAQSKGGTGFGVLTILEYLRKLASA